MVNKEKLVVKIFKFKNFMLLFDASVFSRIHTPSIFSKSLRCRENFKTIYIDLILKDFPSNTLLSSSVS